MQIEVFQLRIPLLSVILVDTGKTSAFAVCCVKCAAILVLRCTAKGDPAAALGCQLEGSLKLLKSTNPKYVLISARMNCL